VNTNNMLMLVRREFWEHRALYIAPLVVVGVLLLLAVFGALQLGGENNFMFASHAQSIEQIPGIDAGERAKIHDAIVAPAGVKQTAYALSILMFSSILVSIACIVVFFYLIDCLYSERRDRSILFWKSLPLSDAQVVLAKLAVALIAVPIGVLLLASVSQILFAGVWWVRFHDTLIGQIFPGFDFGAWWRVQWLSLQLAFVAVIWYLPVAGYLLLASAWARRNVFLWTVLPWLGLIIFEGVIQQGSHVAQFLGERLFGFVAKINLPTRFTSGHPGDSDLPPLDQVMSNFSISGVFLDYQIWVGALAGAALVFAAIRIRRYRDDT